MAEDETGGARSARELGGGAGVFDELNRPRIFPPIFFFGLSYRMPKSGGDGEGKGGVDSGDKAPNSFARSSSNMVIESRSAHPPSRSTRTCAI